MKLCTCLNCGSVYEDLNPGEESVEYPDSLPGIPELPTIKHSGEDYIGYGCSVCDTDGHLSDNLINAGGQSHDLFTMLENIGKSGYSIDEFQF